MVIEGIEEVYKKNMSKTKSFITNIREDFISNVMQLKGCHVECFLNDGSSFMGNFYHYNPQTGEYYIIGKDNKIYIISHNNCLKIVLER